MAFARMKTLTRWLGLYRTARCVYRHTLNRDELRMLRQELAFFASIVPPGSLCFDVGANFGAKSEVLLKLGARVVAFEPQQDCLEELRARLGDHPRLVCVNAAMGSRIGAATLYTCLHRTSSSLLPDWEGNVQGTVEVPVTTLDEAIRKYGMPHYCKIDVEGFELEVLKGLSQPIPVLSFEYHLRKDGIAKALACLDHLGSCVDLLINISPAETPRFERAEWRSPSEFEEFFRSDVPRLSGYDYGDIFARIKPGAVRRGPSARIS